MARVYLETSFLSACVSTRRDAASVYRRDVSTEWLHDESPKHACLVSAEVYSELSSPRYPNRERAIELARRFDAVVIDDAVLGLAAILIRERVMPGPVAGDAIHVAACCIHGIDYLLSWNVRHLANVNKRAHLQTICLRSGTLPPQIVTPDLLWNIV